MSALDTDQPDVRYSERASTVLFVLFFASCPPIWFPTGLGLVKASLGYDVSSKDEPGPVAEWWLDTMPLCRTLLERAVAHADYRHEIERLRHQASLAPQEFE